MDVKAHLHMKVTICIFSLCAPAAVRRWRAEGRVAVWLHIPILQSHLIAPAASLGFGFHHTEPHSSTLTLWLGEGPSRLPGYATHQVGVAGQFRAHNPRNYLFTGLPCLLEAGLLVCQRMLVSGHREALHCATAALCFSEKKGGLARELQGGIENRWSSWLPRGHISCASHR